MNTIFGLTLDSRHVVKDLLSTTVPFTRSIISTVWSLNNANDLIIIKFFENQTKSKRKVKRKTKRKLFMWQ